jgi:hypothetical protein
MLLSLTDLFSFQGMFIAEASMYRGHIFWRRLQSQTLKQKKWNKLWSVSGWQEPIFHHEVKWLLALESQFAMFLK